MLDLDTKRRRRIARIGAFQGNGGANGTEWEKLLWNCEGPLKNGWINRGKNCPNWTSSKNKELIIGTLPPYPSKNTKIAIAYHSSFSIAENISRFAFSFWVCFFFLFCGVPLPPEIRASIGVTLFGCEFFSVFSGFYSFSWTKTKESKLVRVMRPFWPPSFWKNREFYKIGSMTKEDIFPLIMSYIHISLNLCRNPIFFFWSKAKLIRAKFWQFSEKKKRKMAYVRCKKWIKRIAINK